MRTSLTVRAFALTAAVVVVAALAGCGVFKRQGSTQPPVSPGPSAAAPAAPAAAAAPKAPAASVASAPKAPAAPAAAVTAPPVPQGPAFNHQNHLQRGVGCTDCHAGAEEQDRAGMPTLETCMECHEEIEPEAPPEKKVAQFVDAATGKVVWHSWTKQGGDIRFSHAKHFAKKVECASCHGAMDANQRTGPELHLGMADCVKCHTERKASLDCATCHERISQKTPPSNHDPRWRGVHGGIVKGGVKRGPAEDCTLCHTPDNCSQCHAKTAPADHAKPWGLSTAHGAASAKTPDRCAMCHTPDTCSSCHAKTPPQDHTKQFRYGTGHGASAMERPDRCDRCHTDRVTFCADCHGRTPPADHTVAWRNGPGHGMASEARPERCENCHRDTTCLSCHRDSPPRDHTNFWRNGPGHGLAASMGRERCESCHTPDQCVECHTTNPPRSHNGTWGSPRNRHCIGCHETPGALSSSEGGCATCHTGTPSHRLAPPKPSDHRPDSRCLQCHVKLRHPVNDQNCNECHR